MQFGSGILSAEPPVDGDARCVALGLVGRDLALQSVGIGVSPLETGAAHTLNSISAMLSQLACWECGELEAFHDAPGLSRREMSRKGTPYDEYSDCPATTQTTVASG